MRYEISDGSMSQSAGAAAIKLRSSSVRLVFTLCGCSENWLDDLRLYLDKVCKLMSSVRYTEESPRVAMYVKIIFLKELRYSLLCFFVCIGENSRNFVKWFAMVEKQQGQTTEPKRERERFTMATINTDSKWKPWKFKPPRCSFTFTWASTFSSGQALFQLQIIRGTGRQRETVIW